jgi:predicted Zn-dependent protease
MAMQLLGIGLIAANPQAAMGVMVGASGMATQSMLAFTRDEERAADDYAAKLLQKAGMDPSALLSVFQKMQSVRESQVNPNAVNHPLTEERIKNIRLQAKTDPQSAVKNSQLALVQAKLIGYLDSADRVKTLYPAADKSDSALYARAIARMRAGNLQAAKTGTLTLVSRNKNYPYFYELLGDIEFQYGHYDDSAEAYEQALALTKNAPQIEIALALVLSERAKPGDKARAAELCRRALLADPVPLAYWVLAKTDEKKSEYYLAEYYYMIGEAKLAMEHARRAAAVLPADSPEYLKAKDILESKN